MSGGGGSWFDQLEAKLEQQLEAFLRSNPGQEALLQEQEQQDRARARQDRRLALQQQAEALRTELLTLAAEINSWQQRVDRARQAGAEDLADRAEAHRNSLMDQGRQRWQVLVALGEAFADLESEEQAPPGGSRTAETGTADQHPATGPSSGSDPHDLDQAWARFEAEQELEQLRRRQGR